MPERRIVREKKITMKDIAVHLSIDRTTVSKALSPNPGLSQGMVEKVKQAAAELGYYKDPFASGLMTGKNAVLGIVIADEINRNIYSSFVRSFEQVAQDHQHAVIICHVKRNKDDLLKAIRLLKQQRVSGATFVAGTHESLDAQYVIEMTESGMAINVTGSRFAHDSVDSIAYDHKRAGYELTHYLIEQGHRHIMMFSRPGAVLELLDDSEQISPRNSNNLRTQGYLQAMHEAGLRPSVVTIESTTTPPNAVQDSYRALQATGGELGRTSAIVGVSDDHALGVLFALKELGISVPQQISVAGFDDAYATLGVPQLTTMRMPLRESGETAGLLLIERMKTLGKEKAKIVLPYEMIVRGSTGDNGKPM
ncbi:LacI family transcriptional regulator [Paenibacillus hemerocallicola]|uniref:LacI family transcriptional regulator n=1 Tax=Paenibacillus hemerocallicola TaxID=1172614 RepID=A0A5C4T3I2_9BACL|nr:LacI family DNA-binding transcriptional regulator [Paenibacillus hemerocallicola]TNJ63634.1 LacI family transcriptional regulator [Paenibacillus hemerocallicola]